LQRQIVNFAATIWRREADDQELSNSDEDLSEKGTMDARQPTAILPTGRTAHSSKCRPDT